MAFVCGYASCRQRREVTPGPPALFISLEKDRFKSITKSGYLSVQLPGEMGTPGIYPRFLQIDSECRGSGHTGFVLSGVLITAFMSADVIMSHFFSRR